MTEKAIALWSGGKDSALALFETKKSQSYKLEALLTTLTRDFDRISIHGVRRILLERQAEALGLPLKEMFIVKDASNVDYECELLKSLTQQRADGVSAVVCGDIFLEDVRKYRDELLAKAGLRGVYPLWKRNTAELARTFLTQGFKAVITVVDGEVLGKEFAGRDYDEKFLSDLPANVDPCGEKGEFHTFVYAGPLFHRKVTFTRGEVVFRDNRFYFCNLLPEP